MLAEKQALSKPRALRADERQRVCDWLDDGMRGGRRGRLAAEYPGLGREPGPEGGLHQRVVFARERPVAHALFTTATVCARDRGRLEVGMIGSVYTDPRHRGQGLARVCVEACVEALRARGLALAVLWSDRHAWYQRMGFHPAGVERQLRVDAGLCRSALARLGAGPEIRVEEAAPEHFPRLEALYDARPVRSLRAPGRLAVLAAAPDTRVVVATAGGEAIAYAALGRGDDFQGVVHEWAGRPEGVLSALRALCRGRRDGALELLAGPLEEPVVTALESVGAVVHRGCFALARVLGRERLRRALGEGASAPRAASDAELLGQLFDPERAGPEAAFPLYLWGFDGV